MEFKRTLISVAVASALSGCGGGGDGSNDSHPRQLERNSLVCLDANKNARCDADEASEQVATWSDVAVSTALTSTTHSLAYEGEDGLIFTAPAGFSEISLSTTMLANELIYNQVIASKTINAAENYLNDKWGGALSTAHQKDLAEAIKIAITANPNAERYSVIAAVISKAVELGADNVEQIKSININSVDIGIAGIPSLEKLAVTQALSKNVDEKILQQETDGWTNASDSSISVIAAKNGKVIGGSHYHNALTVIDVATGAVSYTPVSTVTDSGHGIDSSTGASENYLRDVSVNTDASYVYVNIPPKNLSSDNFDEETYGLYKAKLEADGSVATVLDSSGLIYSMDETVSKRLAVKLRMFSVSPDDSKVATYDADEFLTVYDANLENPGSPLLLEGLSTFAVSSSTVFIALKNVEDETKGDITKLAVDSLTGDEKITLDFVPQELRLNNDGSKLIAFNHGHDNNGLMSIALIDVATNSVIDTGLVKVTSDTAAVSDDFSKMAIVGHEEDRLLIVNLTVPSFSVQSVQNLDYNARDVAFLNDTQVAITNERNSIAVLDIASTTDNINLVEKTRLALEGLNRASINGGGYFDAVISNLNLSPSYENVAITWAADNSLSTHLNISDGSIIRPSVDGTDVTGVLSATTSVSFRQEIVEDGKTFGLTLRKVPVALPNATIVQTAENSAQYMAANHQGDIMVAPVRFENTNADRVYGFVSVNVVDGQPVIASGTADTPKTYRDTESLVGVGVVDNFVGDANHAYAIGVSAAVGETGQARIFTVAMDTSGVLGETESNSIDINSGEPLKVGFNTGQSLAAVMIETGDGAFITEIYSFSKSGVATLDKTIAMAEAEYKSFGPPAINDDASRVYQRDEDNVIMTSADGTTTASAAVEEIARVWFYNGRVFITTYDGNIVSFNESLDESSRRLFSTGTGGRIYGGVGRELDGIHYLYIPLQRASNENSDRESGLNGIYQLAIEDDGSLQEVALSTKVEGPDRMTVSGDGDTVFFNYRDRSGSDQGQWFGVVTIPE
ncbi:MAG: hypothetical protein KUG83_02665 [Gammaproteobacteria bacterium]|nr:hypothetical protein [Gammaproteobacteria bacterium]